MVAVVICAGSEATNANPRQTTRNTRAESCARICHPTYSSRIAAIAGGGPRTSNRLSFTRQSVGSGLAIRGRRMIGNHFAESGFRLVQVLRQGGGALAQFPARQQLINVAVHADEP